jgi:hypothetical protein
MARWRSLSGVFPAARDPENDRGKGAGNCAAVFHWHQDSPSGFRHRPLGPVEGRIGALLKSPPSQADAPAEDS